VIFREQQDSSYKRTYKRTLLAERDRLKFILWKKQSERQYQMGSVPCVSKLNTKKFFRIFRSK